MNQFWDKIILHNSVRDWTIALSIIVVSFMVIRLFQSIIFKRVKAYSGRTKSTIVDYMISMVQSSGMPLVYVLAVYIGLRYIDLPEKAGRMEHIILMLFMTFFLLRIVTSFVSYLFRQTIKTTRITKLSGEQLVCSNAGRRY